MTLSLMISVLPDRMTPKTHTPFQTMRRSRRNLNTEVKAHYSRVDDSKKSSQFSRNATQYYMLFSTGCTKFQDWQSIVLFYSAKKVNQPGNITRLVSGCTSQRADDVRRLHEKVIAPLSAGFQLHITPDFQYHGRQKYWNKPYAVLDWMKNVLKFPKYSNVYDDAIIILVDPDMLLLRPLIRDFSKPKPAWLGSLKSNHVTHGIPIAQKYAFGSQWLTTLIGNISHVVGPKSPIHSLTLKQAEVYYSAGPPYIVTGRDMYKLTKCWVKFLPAVYDIFPNFMSEMFAYSTAAAHLRLRHQLTQDFMVSDIGMKSVEGFGFLQNKSRTSSCYQTVPTHASGPWVLHYCQQYSLGRWYFDKYFLRSDFLTCHSPLLREPPPNVAEIYDWNQFPRGRGGENFYRRRNLHDTVLHAWMLCTMIKSLNDIAISFKRSHCKTKANFKKSWHFHFDKKELFQAMLDDPTNPYERDNIPDNPP
jgi:peptidyl serine alpha-galactosyltransferase